MTNSLENKDYLQTQLITYLGNKRALLDFIAQAVEQVKKRLNKDKLDCLDLFSGTGVVARFLKQHSNFLLANDLELYSYVSNSCYLANKSAINLTKLEEHFAFINNYIQNNWQSGFISELYAPKDDLAIQSGERVFYTKRNAEYLDTARTAINLLPSKEQNFFVAPLLASASVHTNTSGVFKGFYKSKHGLGQFGGQAQNALQRILKKIELSLPLFSNFACDYVITQNDANLLVQELKQDFDLAYFDPPYNQHPYGSNYFMLNLIANYEAPEQISKVSGIPESWNRSAYNKKNEAKDTLFNLIDNCRAKFILISYNSEGFVDYDSFMDKLKKIGTLEVLETPYNTFKGSRNLAGRSKHVKEFLFLLEK